MDLLNGITSLLAALLLVLGILEKLGIKVDLSPAFSPNSTKSLPKHLDQPILPAEQSRPRSKPHKGLPRRNDDDQRGPS